MALNKYMHPRNPYKTRKPDFKELAIKYPEFREKVTQNLSGKVILDFKDPEALRALTVALLKNDFDVTVSLPIDRLIPTVPQRLNYILWLEDIFEQAKGLKGIDIGTGASCIYPLLGCKLNDWSFLASEIDDQNLLFARKNIQQNNMEDKITVKQVPEDTLLIGLVEDNSNYDFCMCNPPFYSDHLEAQGITTSRSEDRPEPHSVSTASEGESISWGGEVNFVTKMIEESLLLRNRIRVYTSLLGKKINLSLLKDELQRRKITNFSSTEFCQGRTMRWGLAWTFDDTVKFPKSAFKTLKNVKPPITYTVPRDNATISDYTVQAFTKYMKNVFDELKIRYNIIHSGKFYTAMNLQAKENTWSHQRRKRRQKQREETECCTSEHVNLESSSESLDENKLACDNEKQSLDQTEVCPGNDNVKKNLNGKDSINHDDVVPETNNTQGTDSIQAAGKAEDGGLGHRNCKRKHEVENSEVSDLPPKKMKGDTPNNDTGETFKAANGQETEEISEIVSKSAGNNNEQDDKNPVEKEKSGADSESVTNSNDNEMESVNSNIKVNDKEGQSTTPGNGNNQELSDPSKITHLRKDVVEEFHEEIKQNIKIEQSNTDQSKKTKYHNFDENEECLVMFKMVLRKDDGIITLTMEHKTGNKEAMHQVMQYFKNKFAATSP